MDCIFLGKSPRKFVEIRRAEQIGSDVKYIGESYRIFDR
jgi:hypothetical protein